MSINNDFLSSIFMFSGRGDLYDHFLVDIIYLVFPLYFIFNLYLIIHPSRRVIITNVTRLLGTELEKILIIV